MVYIHSIENHSMYIGAYYGGLVTERIIVESFNAPVIVCGIVPEWFLICWNSLRDLSSSFLLFHYYLNPLFPVLHL